MGDPLSVAASIAGLVTITDTVFCRAFKYGKAVKGAPAEIAGLASAIGALSGIVHNLHLIICQLKGQTFDTTIQIHHIHACLKTMESIEKVLDKYGSSPTGHGMKTMKRLRWPFSASEAKSLTIQIEQHKATLSLALAADGLSGLLQALSRQREVQSGIDDIKIEYRQKREADTRIAMSKEHQEILAWIQIHDPRQNHDMSLKLRHPSTGLWLVESVKFKSWLSTPRSKLWCYGIPGAGKTVLASSIIQEVLRQSSPTIAVAFFYCDYKTTITQEPKNVLGSIAKQLAVQDDRSFEKLQTFYESKSPKNLPPVDFSLDELRDLVLTMTSSFNDVMIIVDALDECGTVVQVRSITRLLASLNGGRGAGNSKTLFLSRDEPDIREILEDYDQISIAASSSDLRLYVGAEIELRTRNGDLRIKDQDLKEQIMERLVEGADGMFRWAACQMDHLCEMPSDAACRKALDTLPPTLNATYERILRRVNTYSKSARQLVQRSLRWLVCTTVPIKSRALCEATSVDPGNTKLDRSAIPEADEILRRCSSLVRKSVSGDWLELAHFTVKEFLTMDIDTWNPEYRPYHFDPESDDVVLAETCLTYLSFEDFAVGGIICQDTLCQRWEAFAFREHAVKFWMKYARKHLTKPNILALTNQLLHPAKPFIFVSWAQELLLAVFKVESPDLTKASPLHFAAALALPEACVWLLEGGCNVDQRSVVGTPLECALAGKAALSGAHYCAIPIETPQAELGGPRRSTVNILMNSGADVQYGYLRSSPLYIAIAMSDMISCIALLHKGAIIDEEAAKWLFKYKKWDLSREILENIDKNKIRSKDYATLLKAALMSEDFTASESLADPTHELQDHPTAEPLYLEAFETAAAYGQLSVVQQLLHDYKLDVNAVSVNSGLPALHKAVSNDHVAVVEYLMKHGAECHLTDSEGRTPLHHAVQGGSRCLPLLLDREADTTLGDLHGLTAWHLAASIHNIHAMNTLSEVTGNIRTISRLKALDGRTLLHCAAQSGSRDAIAFFIDHGDGDTVRDTTLNGLTALHYAVEANSLEAVQYLIDNGADTQALTSDGSTTLHCALQHEDPAVLKIVELLLGHGVDPCKARRDGMTPIHVLIENGHTAYAENDARGELNILLNKLAQHASSLNSTDADGLTALHHVCQVHHVDSLWDWRLVALETLLDNGADPSVEDRNGSTALMYLIESWKKQVVDPAKEDLKFGEATLSSAAMVGKALACIVDSTLISTTCAEPHLLCLALMFREEALAYEALKYCSSVDSIAYQFSEMSPLEIACQYGCSRQLLAELLRNSNFHRGAAGSRTQLLRFACERNRSSLETTVADLLSLGFDPKDRTSEGKTALMFAAQAGSPAVVKNLIHHGADISATDNHGWTIIHYACEGGDLELLYLIKTMPMAWDTRITAKLGTTWSRHATVLHLAASLDNCSLEFLLKNRLVADINSLTQCKDTPLYVAALWGISNNVSMLLDWNADDELVTSLSESPLHAASRLGHLDVVMVFIDKACNLQLQDGSGLRPELVARKYGYADIAEVLKERASEGAMEKPKYNSIEAKQKLQVSPEQLKFAIELGDLELCQALVTGGIDSDSGFPDCNGCTPVLYAFAKGYFDIAGYLISQGASIAGTACSATSARGYTPFHFAAGFGLVQVLQVLLERAPRGIARCCQPVLPMALAIAGDHSDCVELILNHAGEEDGGTDIEHVCEGSYNLNHLISTQICGDRLRWPWHLPYGPTIQQLQLTTATPLHIAASLGRVEIARSLMICGASVHATDAHFWTPLHHAASQNQTQMVETLLYSGANANVMDSTLRTPCMWAASRGFLTIVIALIEGGTDLTLKDRVGRTALHWATASGAWNVAIFLINHAKGCELTTVFIDGDSVLIPSLSTLPAFFGTFLLNLAPDPSVYEPRQSNMLSSMAVTNNRLYLKRFLRRLPKTLVPNLLSHRALNMGTPLYVAATHPAEEVIDTLLNAGADLELEGGEHGTPLMGACAAGRLKVVRMLISRGAKTSIVKDGRVFSVIAAARLHPMVIRWLLVGRFMENPRLLTNG